MRNWWRCCHQREVFGDFGEEEREEARAAAAELRDQSEELMEVVGGYSVETGAVEWDAGDYVGQGACYIEELFDLR